MMTTNVHLKVTASFLSSLSLNSTPYLKPTTGSLQTLKTSNFKSFNNLVNSMEIIKISAITNPRFFTTTVYLSSLLSPSPSRLPISTSSPLLFNKFPAYPHPQSSFTAKRLLVLSRATEETENSVVEEEWVQHLPDKTKPLYSHSLPCLEGWLKKLGFYQSKDDRAIWFVEKPDWHAQLSLDVTDLYIRYLKSGPGNLEKDMERRFSYALSREDIENAILGGP